MTSSVSSSSKVCATPIRTSDLHLAHQDAVHAELYDEQIRSSISAKLDVDAFSVNQCTRTVSHGIVWSSLVLERTTCHVKNSTHILSLLDGR